MGHVGGLLAARDVLGATPGDCIHLGGTSVGALVAFLFVVGYSIEEVVSISCEEDFESLLDLRFEGLFRILRRSGESESSVLGLDTGETITRRVGDLLFAKTGMRDMPLANLPALRGQHLTVVVSCLETSQPVYLSSRDECPYKHMSTVNAVVASMRIPGVFTPFAYDHTHTFVDGGLTDNFPLAAMLETDTWDIKPHECLGFRLSWDTNTPKFQLSEASVSVYAETVLKTLMRCLDEENWRRIVDQGLEGRVISVHVAAKTLEMSLRPESRLAVIFSAYREVRHDLQDLLFHKRPLSAARGQSQFSAQMRRFRQNLGDARRLSARRERSVEELAGETAGVVFLSVVLGKLVTVEKPIVRETGARVRSRSIP